MTTPDLPRVLRAWRAAGDLVALAAPADPAEILSAEEELGHRLPPEVAALYAECNGMSLSGGDLRLTPLRGDGIDAVTTAAGQLREWDWPVPAELLVLGDNGGGEAFGVWLAPGATRWPVVQLGSPGEEPALAVFGTTLGGFLAAWTTFYLTLDDEDPAVPSMLEVLGVPPQLRRGDTEERMAALLGWGSPDLPDPQPDPYARPLTPAEVTRLAT